MDAYNANPSSMRAAIEHFAAMQVRPKVLIMGDMLELGEETLSEHQSILQLALESGFDQVITVGAHFGTVRNADKNHYDSTDHFLAHLQLLPIQKSYILLKGSRKIGLEKLLA
jgi:UDP-N-acetylmuramoyl-tripeptide--D-alanyl-D-alanine ligase